MSTTNQLSMNNHQNETLNKINEKSNNPIKQSNESNQINHRINNQVDNRINNSQINNQINNKQINNQINNQIDNQINQQSNNQLNGNLNMNTSEILKENEIKIKETDSLANSINKQYTNGHHNDSLSEASFSDDKSTDDKLDNGLSELFPNVIFTLKEVFRLSVKFTKDNENKAFFPTYDDRNYLYALNYQIRYGPFVEEDSPKLEVGALDFVGKDRRLAWKSLGNLSKEAAMVQFIKELNRICPIYKPYIEAHNQEKVEREKILREEEEKKRIEEEEKLRKLEKEKIEREELERKERQKQELREALKKQTYVQFKSYAQQQYPNDPLAQENLIRTLEENHFQQFIQQQMQFQQQNKLNQMNPTSNQQDELIDRMQQFNLNGDRADNTNFNNFDNKFQQQQQDYLHNFVNQEEEDEEIENEEESNNEDEEEESESEIEYDNNYEGRRIEVLQPQMWTKKVIKQFKEAISIDNGDGIVKIGYGESLTIRVPTHPDGKCIVWEFATDNYDIGFGLFFEFNEDPGDQITIQVSESEEDDDIDDDDDDLEKGALSTKNKKNNKTEYVAPIIPVYRRDSHEEVFCGSHVYPGKGTYLLKFDNTYSLWRSKTLYYRVLFSS